MLITLLIMVSESSIHVDTVAGEAETPCLRRCTLYRCRGTHLLHVICFAMAGVHQVVALWACAVVMLSNLHHTRGQDPSKQQVFTFVLTDLYGLQQLYGDWNKSTPDLGKNLAGWRAFPNNLESTDIPCPCFRESWQGVLCLRQSAPTLPGFNYQNYSVYIVGLALTDASLTGSLPPAIGNLTNLVSLTITENQNLKGALPQELQLLSFNLNILDLQGNGFNGSIPSTLGSLLQLQTFDLSGNQFGGTLQVDFRGMKWLRTLNLSRNSLTGNIQQEYLQNLGQLITLDLSSNSFAGPLFNLTKSPSLNTLNLSHNGFSGEVSPSYVLNITNSFNLKVLDLSNNSLSGLLPDFSAWTNLSVLDLSYNQFQAAPFPTWIATHQKALQVLRLSGNNLIGPFPTLFVQDLKNLEIIVLDNNQINATFDILEVIQGLPILKSLSIINNNITNVFYNGSSIKAIEKFGINLQGNPYCAQTTSGDYLKSCVCEQQCVDPDPKQSSNKVAVVATSVASSLLTLVILVMSLVYCKTRREKQKLQIQVQQYFAENDIKPTIFTLHQLRSATEDFSERTKLGQGSFGAVYKGYLQADANPVAVKQLFLKSNQSIAAFLNEVVVVTAIKHRNLVRLKGCCVREDQRLLVYEYMENNNLEDHLFNEKAKKHLDWPTRSNICLGVARGLHYLHESAQPRIIHRDIKASNILLDKDCQPKIADFGLALFFPDEKTNILTTHVAGTRGYWAPEYVTRGQLSEKADVYSFGVLLLEIVSGRKNLDFNMPERQVCLSQWAKDMYNISNVMEVVDPTLPLDNDQEAEVRRVINIALLCLQEEPEQRPTMGAIVATLEGSLDVEAEGMRHYSQTEATRATLEALPLRDIFASLSSSEMAGPASAISLASMGNYSGFRTDSSVPNLSLARD